MQLIQPHARLRPLEVDGVGVKRFHIWTIGCQMNEAESAKAAALFRTAGYLPAPREWDADIVIVNTCVVRQHAEDKALGYIGALARLKRRRPEVRIAVTGCLVTGQEQRLAERFPWVDLWYGPSEFARLAELVPELTEVDIDLLELPHYYDEGQADTEVTAFVPIIYGCNFVCSYCIVPYRRGRERSRPINDVVAEVEKLAARGVREVTLLGQTVNAYGHDLPERVDLADLLARVHAVEGIERIRFLTSHPKYFTDTLIHAIADLPKVCEHVNLPVQSGDNEVLRRMRRNYTVEEYRERIARIRELIPNVTLSTDIIVGFPGETEEQFLNTYRLIEEIRFDKVHVAMYSPRPGTLSARWPDDVPRQEKRRRHRAIEELQARIARERHARYVGQVVEVLVDGLARGRWRGRTRGNTLVFLEAPGELRGHLVQVRVTQATPWYLFAEPVSIESRAPVVVQSMEK